MLSKLKNNIRRLNEKRHFKKLRSRLSNTEFTLVTNNCVGGVIYHNLGLQFNSPTINLSIRGEDYLHFVENFKYYMGCKVTQIKDDTVSYPVGMLVSDDPQYPSIKIYFDHYDSFDSAVNKWHERIKRINYDKLVFLWEFYNELYDDSLALKFDSLPINKLLLLHDNVWGGG